MADIKVNVQAFEDLIEKLEGDNKAIYNVCSNINIAIRGLDSSFWTSREKTTFDEVMEPFMTEHEYDLLTYLNECTNLLRAAKDAYQTSDEDLTGAVNNS